jgi:cysteine-rich repeat protein
MILHAASRNLRPSLVATFVLVSVALWAPSPASSQMTVQDGCIEDVFAEFGQGGGLTCTANDVSIAGVTGIEIKDDGCAFLGDTVTFDATLEVLLTAQDRHDVGIYIAADGGTAFTGSCFISTLPYQPNDESCTAAGVPFACCTGLGTGTCAFLDLDGTGDDLDGPPKTGACQNDTSIPCNANVDCVNAGVGGTCVALGPGIQDLCGDIVDSTDPRNPIFHDVTNITVMCVDSNNDGGTEVGACTSWRQPGENDLCLSPLYAFPGAPSKCNCQTLEFLILPKTIEVCKELIPPTDPGLFNLRVDGITYLSNATDGDCTGEVEVGAGTHTVSETGAMGTNLGNYGTAISCVDSVGKCTLNASIRCLSNSQCSSVGAGTCDLTPTVVASCANCTSSPVVVPNEPSTIVCTITNGPPAIEVTKTANPTEVDEPGGSVTFSVTVQNNLAVNVTVESLFDDVFGDVTLMQGAVQATTCSVPQLLAPSGSPGDSYTCSFTGTVSGNAGDIVTDVVSATGEDQNNVEVFGADDATVTILNVPSAIQVEKTADPTSLPEPGGLVTFTVVVTNLSDVDGMTVTALEDSVHGNLDNEGTCAVPLVLAPGAFYTCSFTATVTGNAFYTETDVVTVTAIDDDDETIEDDDSASVTLLDVPSAIQVQKTANLTQVNEPGGNVIFTVVVTNTSTVDTVTITTLTDDIFGNLHSKGTCAVPQGPLAPGASYTCSFTEVVSGNAGQVKTNVVTAAGTDDDGQPVQDTDDAVVTILNVPSAIRVLKTADPTEVDEPGGNVSFTVVVENLSAVDTVTITTLTDSVYGSLNPKGTCSVPQTLPPGASYTCFFTAPVVGNAFDVETDVVTASGADDDSDPVSDNDDASVTIQDVPSVIEVTKTANPDAMKPPGGPVTFTVVVANLSTADTVTITALTDSVHGNLIGKPGSTCSVPQALAPGASYTCTFTATVSGVDGYTETDLVTASGVDDDGFSRSATDSATVSISSSAIRVIKTATPKTVTEPGGSVTFTFEVRNISEIDAVTLETLVDSVYGDLAGKPGSTCSVPQTIQPGASYTCSFTTTVSGRGGTVETNVVTATGVDEDNLPVSAKDSATVTIVDLPSSIFVAKTAIPRRVDAPGGVVTFVVTVTNTSRADRVIISSLEDSIHGNLNGRGTCVVPQSILPRDSYTCEFTEEVSGAAGYSERNVATVAGVDDDGNPISGSAAATVHVTGCGDGNLEPGEDCDDGNREYGDGCTASCEYEVPITPICNHPCPAKITLRRGPLDKFSIRTGFMPIDPFFKPSAVDFSITLLNANGVVYTAALRPGDFVRKGRAYYLFKDPEARSGNGSREGLQFVSISRRRDLLWRFDLKAVADISTATEAEMTVIVRVGGEFFTKTAIWDARGNGWVVNFRQLPGDE